MTFQTETIDPFMDLEPIHSAKAPKGFVVIHPLHDAPEAKCDLDRLGPITLSRGSRAALVTLRCYLVGVMLMGAWRVALLAHSLRH